MNSKTSLFEITADSTSFLKKRLDFITEDREDPMFARATSEEDVPMIISERPCGFLTSAQKKPIMTSIPMKHPSS